MDQAGKDMSPVSMLMKKGGQSWLDFDPKIYEANLFLEPLAANHL